MSGPKTAEYQVRKNRKVAARARREAMARAQEVRAVLDAVHREIKATRARHPEHATGFDVPVPSPPPEDASVDVIDRYRRALSDAVSEGRRALRVAVASTARAETQQLFAKAVEGLAPLAAPASTDLIERSNDVGRGDEIRREQIPNSRT